MPLNKWKTIGEKRRTGQRTIMNGIVHNKEAMRQQDKNDWRERLLESIQELVSETDSPQIVRLY